MAEKGLRVSGLKKSAGKKSILNGVEFFIRKGTSVGFIGDNGAGKTTTIKILAGINSPDSGEVSFDGKNPFEMKNANLVGYLPEKTYFPPYMTGTEFVRFMCELSEIPFDEERIGEAFEKMKLSEAKDSKISSYSKGMMQRLGFVTLLANPNTEYFFLDEPLSGLDHVGQLETLEIINSLKKDGITVFMTSHHMNEIEKVCDEIVFLKEGAVIHKGIVKDIVSEYGTLKDYYISVSKNGIQHS